MKLFTHPCDVVLSKSSWFTRGWTLQELLAPKNLLFFDTFWEPMSWKGNILQELEECTGIPRAALEEFYPARHCVATKMSVSRTQGGRSPLTGVVNARGLWSIYSTVGSPGHIAPEDLLIPVVPQC